MKKNHIFRAWRDGEYFASLSEEERAALPGNPAALPFVEDEVLNSVSGGCTLLPGWICPTSKICSPCPSGHCV